LPLTLLARDVAAERRPGENLEAAARRVRYAALESVRRTLGADRILTAHHRDDQLETILMRIASGSGLLGLAGIRERRGFLWRPALGRSRAELGEVVALSGLEPVRDPTNADLARRRNRIRHALLPHLRRTDPGFDAALGALALRASGAREALERRLTSIYGLEKTENGARLAGAALAQYPPLLNLFALQLLEVAAGFATP
jgi:tRNA(Ile)-lysidine synthase